MDQRRCAGVIACVTLGLFLTGLMLFVAQTPVVKAQERSVPPDSACKLCHVGKNETSTLPSGDIVHLDIDLATLADSVHGSQASQAVYCTDCHRSRQRYLYPHQPNPAQSRKEFRADIGQNCQQCHESLQDHNPGHLHAADKTTVPTCADCHGGHNITSTAAIAADPVGTCQSCHATFKDPRAAAFHEEIMANLPSGQDCLVCHLDRQVPANEQCTTCHSLLRSQMVLSSGQEVDLHVDPAVIESSVHGHREISGTMHTPFQCTDCHRDQQRYGFPHSQMTAETRRELTLQMEAVCQECHQEIFERQHHGIHAIKQAEGQLAAASCADCHGNHAIQDPDQPCERVSQTCGKCHSTINAQYENSVHGAALLGEHNPDVPVCTDCHGVHDIADPTSAVFRVNSPDLCGACHADKALMAKYNISTDVFDTYVADFHGTTVTLFERQSPEQQTNKAVCYDCHGIHDILPVTDENSQVIKENLLTTCRQCHPDASANFPDSWTSHFKPSLEHNPLVYLVNLFYLFLIPTVVGGFILFIAADLYRRTWERRQ